MNYYQGETEYWIKEYDKYKKKRDVLTWLKMYASETNSPITYYRDKDGKRWTIELRKTYWKSGKRVIPHSIDINEFKELFL